MAITIYCNTYNHLSYIHVCSKIPLYELKFDIFCQFSKKCMKNWKHLIKVIWSSIFSFYSTVWLVSRYLKFHEKIIPPNEVQFKAGITFMNHYPVT